MDETLAYRPLRYSECERIREIDASQYIGRAWRMRDGVRQLVDIHYHDPDYPNGYEEHLSALQTTLQSGGSALGAFRGERLVGFCAVNSEVFGAADRYVLLDQLFVSRGHRAQGIGRQLFLRSVDFAKRRGADKYYICAGSSEETLAFYRAMGCVEAQEINRELFDQDERDIQLEYAFP